MRILIACEYSGRVRDAFRARGHDAISCDLLDTEVPGPHYKGSILDILTDGWDLMIAHPPCTHLAVSGARWFSQKQIEQQQALDFVQTLLNAPINRIALENPVSIISTKIRKPDQIIQPYHFGDPFRKTTCLWLKNLPLLQRTSDLQDGYPECWREPPGPERWKNRSRTYPSIAKAMAEQWGGLEKL